MPAAILAAISVGAVAMGANTYIGNAPNFMVKAIAEDAGVKMPSFFGYMLYSGAILLPLFVVVTLLFFADERRAPRLHLRRGGAVLHVPDERAQRRGVRGARLAAARELPKDDASLRRLEVAREQPLGAEAEQLGELDAEPRLVVVHDDLLAAVERDLAVGAGPRVADEPSDFAHPSPPGRTRWWRGLDTRPPGRSGAGG